MARPYLTGMLTAAVALAATPVARAGQDPRPDATELPAIRLRVNTLASFINQIAGLRVRVISGVVDEIASPRVFTLKNERNMSDFRRPAEVAIVLSSGQAVLREGAPVVVTGIARTLLGAELNTDQPLPALTEDEREVIADFALVVATAVETPDGVALVRTER